MRKITTLSVLLPFAGLAMACMGSPSTPSAADPVGSAVAATQTEESAPATISASAEPAAMPATAETTAAPGTPIPACLPVPPGAQSLPLPAAVAAGSSESITIKDIHDVLLGSLPADGMTFMREDMVHFAGRMAQGPADLPYVYFLLSGGGRLRSRTAGGILGEIPAPNLVALIGAEGNPFLVYATVDMMNQSTNQLYANDLAGLGSAAPVLTWIPDPAAHIGNAIRPLAVRYADGAAEGFWYTYTMEGIGDVHYPPFNGLFFFDLASSASTEYLPATDALGGISPDQTMIAYGAGQGGTPGVIRGGLTVKNLVSCQETYLPFNAASNLGGGWMVFSPDDQFLAWTEAGGPDNMNAAFRMRVARTDGTSLFDAPTASMTSLLGGESPDSLRPVGWIAGHLLVLEAYLNAIHRSVVIVWAPDPAQPLDPVLGANQSAPIADGTFLGFVYP
jgi:hypothetical protein